MFELWMQPAVRVEPFAEVSVHNANSSFGLQQVLILLTQHAAETFHVCALAAAEPKIDKGFGWIVIRHGRVNVIEVDHVENQVSDVRDSLLAEVTPEIGRAFDIALEIPTASKTSGNVVCQAKRWVLQPFGPPVYVFTIHAVVAMDSRTLCEKVFKFLESSLDQSTRRVMIAYIM